MVLPVPSFFQPGRTGLKQKVVPMAAAPAAAVVARKLRRFILRKFEGCYFDFFNGLFEISLNIINIAQSPAENPDHSVSLSPRPSVPPP